MFFGVALGLAVELRLPEVVFFMRARLQEGRIEVHAWNHGVAERRGATRSPSNVSWLEAATLGVSFIGIRCAAD